jgi:putative effector of murein hydrolase
MALEVEAGSDEDRSSSTQRSCAGRVFQTYGGLAILFAIDVFLKLLLSPYNIPAPLVGMAIIVTVLAFLRPRPSGTTLRAFFAPTVDWVARKWLPCFYSPALATTPLALASLSSSDLAKAGTVTAIGVVLTAGFTSRLAIAIRASVAPNPGIPTPSNVPPSSHRSSDHPTFTAANRLGWAAVLAVSSTLVLAFPTSTPSTPLFFMFLSSTMVGYILGMALPENVKRVFHPIIACAAGPNCVAAVVGTVTGAGYSSTLETFLTRGQDGVYGAGDALFAFLGVIVLCFGFKVHDEWDELLSHRAEVLGSTASAAAFTMFTTAFLARLVALPTTLARALVPRGATLALALPVARELGGPEHLTAAGVALTGILGGNFVQLLLNGFGARDPVSRGLTAAATAHGLGVAAMAAREPESLPFAALSYALCGISTSILIYVPYVKPLLMWLTK